MAIFKPEFNEKGCNFNLHPNVCAVAERGNDAALSNILNATKGHTLCCKNILDDSGTGATPLHYAAKSGRINMAELLIKHGYDVNAGSENLYVPLHVAAKWEKTDMVEFLIQKGAHVNAVDKFGSTPLHFAVQKFNLNITKLLLESGADVGIADSRGYTPLMRLSNDIGKEAKEIRELLIKHTDIHTAAKYCDEYCSQNIGYGQKCYQERIESLIKQGIDINAKDSIGYTPLHWAAEKGCKEIVELLTQHSDIHWVTKQGYQEIVESLVKHGADINAKDKSGCTPLHLAKSVKMVDFLINHGADINAEDNSGYTPLRWAAKQGYQEIVESLVKHGADINAKDRSGCTLLHLAESVKMVDLLINNGADINAKNDSGDTSLHWAAKQGHQEIVELLIKHDADIVKNKDGKRPSELATDELLRLKVENYEQVKEIERIKKLTDEEKAEEAAKAAEEARKAKEAEEAREKARAALEKELKSTEEKLKEVTDEKTNALEKLSKLQKDMRELEKEQPVIEKVLLDVKKEFDNCGLLQKLGSITHKLEGIQKGMPEIAAYYSTDQSRFEDVINDILSNAELLKDNKMKSNIVTTVKEMLDMLKKCGLQSEEKLYLITDQVDEIGKNMLEIANSPTFTIGNNNTYSYDSLVFA